MGITIPVTGFAAPPSVVGGITANYEDGQVIVQWNPVEEATYYRVYYSSRSILENGGVYDDFETTTGPVTEHILLSDVLTKNVFVSVLAVNAAGEESAVFQEETFTILKESDLTAEGVRLENFAFAPREPKKEDTEIFNITIPSGQREEVLETPEEVQIPTQEQADDGGKLHLLLAETISPTEVLLTFSTFPEVDPARAPEAFRIVDANGLPLRIVSIYIQEELIAVRTDTQVRNEQYQVILSEPLQGRNGYPLDEHNRKVLFLGHKQGLEYGEVVAIEQQPTQQFPTIPQQKSCDPRSILNPPQVSGLRIRSVASADGTHTLTAQWSIDTKNCQDMLRYIIRQSNDRGRSFTEPQIAPTNISGIEIPGVSSGEYGIGISVISAQGYVSKEVFQSITLPGSESTRPAAPPPQQAPIPRQPVPLPQSGAGLLLGGMLALGSAFGARKARRK